MTRDKVSRKEGRRVCGEAGEDIDYGHLEAISRPPSKIGDKDTGPFEHGPPAAAGRTGPIVPLLQEGTFFFFHFRSPELGFDPQQNKLCKYILKIYQS
jgi:hypothetical protein